MPNYQIFHALHRTSNLTTTFELHRYCAGSKPQRQFSPTAPAQILPAPEIAPEVATSEIAKAEVAEPMPSRLEMMIAGAVVPTLKLGDSPPREAK